MDQPFLAGTGEMATRMRAFDWSNSPLGLPSHWPQTLRTTVRLILNTNHPALIAWGPQLRCLYNDAYAALMGTERHPAALGAPAEHTWEEVWHQIKPQFEQVLGGHGAVWRENVLLPFTRNGEFAETWWTYSYSPIDDADSPCGIGGVLVLCSDVSALQRAHRDADADRAQLLELFEHAPGFIAAARGPEHILTMANAAYLRLVGRRDVTELLGKPVREALPELVGQGYFERLDQVYRTGEPYLGKSEPIRFRMATDGAKETLHYISFLYQPVRDAQGTVCGIVAEGFDVTDHKQIEEALRRQVEANDAIFAYSRDIVCSLDEEARFERVSASVHDILGYDPQALIGRSYFDFIHPDDLERTRQQRQRLRTEGPTTAFETRVIASDGTAVPLLWSAVWVEELRHTYAIGRDLSERLQVEAQLRQAQKTEALGRLTGGLAHDFNNLLTVILNNADDLITELDAHPPQRARAELVRLAAERGAELTRSLLAVARQQVLSPQVLDVATLAARVLHLVDRTLGEDIETSVTAAPELWPIYADAAQLEAALLNLCINARDAMPDGGQLRIELSNRAAESLDDAQAAAGDFVCITVADTGIGMTAETAARATDPFFTTKDTGKGSGLGLAMVNGFVQQSGGFMRIDTEPRNGTRFLLFLPRHPVAADDAAGGADTAPSAEQAVLPARILLVEDNELVRDNAILMLRSLGYGVTPVASAAEALAVLAHGPPCDLVFSDVVMPGAMNGVELAAAIRASHPDLPVLLTSGYADGYASLDSGSAAHAAFLPKPYRRKDLADTLSRLLERARGKV